MKMKAEHYKYMKNAIREARKENYSPCFANSVLWGNFQKTISQVCTEKFGVYVWLNIEKRDIVLY